MFLSLLSFMMALPWFPLQFFVSEERNTGKWGRFLNIVYCAIRQYHVPVSVVCAIGFYPLNRWKAAGLFVVCTENYLVILCLINARKKLHPSEMEGKTFCLSSLFLTASFSPSLILFLSYCFKSPGSFWPLLCWKVVPRYTSIWIKRLEKLL